MSNIENDDLIYHIHDDSITQHAHDVYHGFDTHYPTQIPTSIPYNNIIEINNNNTSISNINVPNNYLLYFILIKNLMNII